MAKDYCVCFSSLQKLNVNPESYLALRKKVCQVDKSLLCAAQAALSCWKDEQGSQAAWAHSQAAKTNWEQVTQLQAQESTAAEAGTMGLCNGVVGSAGRVSGE